VTRVAVCELGPVTIRRLDGVPRTADPDLADAALQAGDDPMTVVGERAVRTAAVWRRVLTPLLDGASEAHLIHPSWWPATRPAMVAAAAAGLADRVLTRPRSASAAADAVVEIGPDQLLVARAGGHVVETRSGTTEALAARVAELVDGAGSVALDAPADVPGATVLGGLITARLRTGVTPVDPRQWAIEPAAPDLPTPARAGNRWRWVAGVGLGGALAGAAWLAAPEAAVDAPPTVALVEGRISTAVPDGWAVRRVTDGPGSARLEVAAPGEPAAVLHLTQAAVPGGDLPAVAATLHAALREQPPGVFVDFNPTDRRAQRPAITYREIRPGAEIRWTVLVDDGIRIGIGCVGPPELSAVCDAAIGSAHRIR